MSNPRSRQFTFTLNNYPESYQEKLMKLKDIRYFIVGQETAPTTGTPHLQGYLQFEKPTRMKQCIKRFQTHGLKPHIEIAKGSLESNITYCSKEDKNPTIFGEPKKERQRTDLQKIYNKIKQGEIKSKKELMDYDFESYARYRGGFKDALEANIKTRSQDFRQVEVEYVYGPTGTGKTRYLHSHENLFVLNGSDLQWWDGYEGEAVLGINEYDNNLKCSDLLSLLDGYTKRLPIKGSHTYANWTKVIITSNLEPSEVHQQAKDKHRQALWRRVTRLIQCPSLDKKIIHGKDKFDEICYMNIL